MSNFQFSPQPLAMLQERYPAATETLYDHLMVAQGRQASATARPDLCVFDCEDGLRLIISRDLFHDRVEGVHFSASVRPDTTLAAKVEQREIQMNEFMHEAIVRFLSISGMADHQRRVLLSRIEFLGEGQPSVFHFRSVFPKDMPKWDS